MCKLIQDLGTSGLWVRGTKDFKHCEHRFFSFRSNTGSFYPFYCRRINLCYFSPPLHSMSFLDLENLVYASVRYWGYSSESLTDTYTKPQLYQPPLYLSAFSINHLIYSPLRSAGLSRYRIGVRARLCSYVRWSAGVWRNSLRRIALLSGWGCIERGE